MHRVEAACLVAGLRKSHSELVAHQFTAHDNGELALAARVAVAVEAVALALKDLGQPLTPLQNFIAGCDCNCVQCETGAHCGGDFCRIGRKHVKR